ncbi:MAG: hypothetical protein K2K98_01145 [Muribaculaceae bacterium]|nr:hypothetical protein [Muribaculaceae bacterium]
MPIERFDTEKYNQEEENLLEYMIAVADRFAPDFVIGSDGNAYEVDSQAPFIFKRRYNQGKLKVSFSYTDYLKHDINDNENAIDIIRALGIDVEKFWYLLLFVADYVEGSTTNTLICSPSPREEIKHLIDFIEDNEDSVHDIYGVKHRQPMKLTLQIKGHRLIIDNPNTISAIGGMCGMALENMEYISFLDQCPSEIADKKDSVRIWLFAKMLRCFFDIHPQFAAQRKTGNDTTKSTLRLISKLVYMVGLTSNEDYCTDDENLKGILKQYRNYNIDTINTIYG